MVPYKINLSLSVKIDKVASVSYLCLSAGVRYGNMGCQVLKSHKKYVNNKKRAPKLIFLNEKTFLNLKMDIKSQILSLLDNSSLFVCFVCSDVNRSCPLTWSREQPSY